MSNLILKYNISEKDLYALGLIETKKKSAGYLEKEKLKAASLKILKPYNVKFMDIGGISGEIKQGGFDNKYSDSISQEEKLAIEKMIQENSNVSKFFKEFWDGKSKKQKWIIVIAVLFVFGFIGSVTDDKTSSSSSSSSSSYKAQIQCGWCGKSFNKGTGYNTLMRVINTPETSYSKYCSRSCATTFLRNN